MRKPCFVMAWKLNLFILAYLKFSVKVDASSEKAVDNYQLSVLVNKIGYICRRNKVKLWALHRFFVL